MKITKTLCIAKEALAAVLSIGVPKTIGGQVNPDPDIENPNNWNFTYQQYFIGYPVWSFTQDGLMWPPYNLFVYMQIDASALITTDGWTYTMKAYIKDYNQHASGLTPAVSPTLSFSSGYSTWPEATVSLDGKPSSFVVELESVADNTGREDDTNGMGHSVYIGAGSSLIEGGNMSFTIEKLEIFVHPIVIGLERDSMIKQKVSLVLNVSRQTYKSVLNIVLKMLKTLER